MEESLGQQYALQIAVQTMKERCLQLQQRLSVVEEENMKLRLKADIDSLNQATSDASELEILQVKVVQLTKQKSQLTHNVLMVATENKHLWSRLSKLTQANQTMGSHLSKINDTLNQVAVSDQSQSALIRSKTFTHETPPPKLIPKDQPMFVDSSLEDISLKLISNIAQEKLELEKQCAQMDEMQSNDSFLSSSFGFAYPQEELDDCTVAEIVQTSENLKLIKDTLAMQTEKLKTSFEILKIFFSDSILCENCKENKNLQKSTEIKDHSEDLQTVNSNLNEDNNRMCPMCSKFLKLPLNDFIRHVGEHFKDEENPDDFEIVSENDLRRK